MAGFDARIPVMLITGPIGAGRTALVGALVAAAISDVDETSSLDEGETAPSGLYEVIKRFGSSLYVRIPDTTAASADERDRGRIRAALAGDVVY